MKATLSPQESATLIAKGISADKASERTLDFCDIITPLERREILPIFTLADLLALLPKNIDTIYSLEICADNSGWDIVYGTYHEGYEPKHIAADKELVNALYSALCWAIDHNHVKLD